MDKEFVNALIEAGIHFGHRSGRWNPKMKPYIFCARNSIHIIDIKQTVKGLLRSKKLLSKIVASGQDVLFVGTKRQARQPIQTHSERCGMHYVTERWLGGTLTNFRTIRSRLGRLEELEAMEENGQLASESKKMQSMLRREMRKIKINLEGIRKMERLPGVLVVIDAKREHNAVNEARKLNIPTISLIDTDSDPDLVDMVIPGNDDAMKAIELVVKNLADGVLEGKEGRVDGAEGRDKAGGEVPRRSRRVSTARAADELVGGEDDAARDPDRPTENAAPAAPASPTPAVEEAASSERPA